MSPRLFICISTGQNIANVAPLLAEAKAEDRILILSSKVACAKRWSPPALDVLARHGLAAEDIAVAGDEPEAFAATLAKLPALAKAAGIVFVANGGSKLQAIAVFDALRKLTSAAGIPLSLLYSEDGAVRLSWFEQNLEKAAKTTPYGHTPLCLADVLRLRRKVVADLPDAAGTLLYEAGCLSEAGRVHAGQPMAYGQDPAQTRMAHDSAAYRELLAATFTKTTIPKWKQVAQLHPEGAERVRQALAKTFRFAFGEKQLEGLYNFIINSASEVIDHQHRQATTMPPATGGDGLGRQFERAVIARLCRWLDQRRPGILRSAHANVKIADADAPGIVLLEADVLLLLKNGLLIMIEAKSHTAEFKDLDARIVNLQRSTSELARVWVCSPLYTAFADKDWFGAHHHFVERVKAHGLTHIPFTLPRQPSSYEWPRQPGADAMTDTERASNPAPRTHAVESFETALARLLEPFGAS